MKLVESRAIKFETEEIKSHTVPGMVRYIVRVKGEVAGLVEKQTADTGYVEWAMHYIDSKVPPFETSITVPYTFSGPLGKMQAIGAVIALYESYKPTE